MRGGSNSSRKSKKQAKRKRARARKAMAAQSPESPANQPLKVRTSFRELLVPACCSYPAMNCPAQSHVWSRDWAIQSQNWQPSSGGLRYEGCVSMTDSTELRTVPCRIRRQLTEMHSCSCSLPSLLLLPALALRTR